MTYRARLPVAALAVLAAVSVAACGSAASSASSPASATQAAVKAPASHPATVTGVMACQALASWERNSSGSIETDTALQETFRETVQPVSGDFAKWVSDGRAGSSAVSGDAGLVAVDCLAYDVTVFPPPAPAPSTAPASTAPPAPQTVTFEVTGSYAQVTYGPAGSDLSGTVPMKVTDQLGDPIYYALTAQLQGGGTVSCKILVNGSVISSSTASGGYNIAQCEISPDPINGGWENTNAG